MSKLQTIQKRNNLNEVHRVDVPGPGGGYHQYYILMAGSDSSWIDQEPSAEGVEMPDSVVGYVSFQNGPRKAVESIPGVLDCDLLEIVRDRLKAFQKGEFATRENAIALTHIEEALLWMNKRVEDRAEQNILGTYKKGENENEARN